ncbi:hypothetical protein B0181_04810 [Moraxella caviae]|uniref:M23ase beta-sheet core domain-containing protein n=1 Tax=Moraxella caviae TaxID=34060 RepID=A0A1T0A3Q9_9GAMM|nr:hypothetical protein B0181_04810 [Moraxella caviae]
MFGACATSAAANSTTTNTSSGQTSKVVSTADAPKAPNTTGGQYTDAQVQAYFINTGRPPNVSTAIMPNEAFKRSGGRFGEDREGRPHYGIDLSNKLGTPLMAIDDGTVVRTGVFAAGGNGVSVRRKGLQDGFRFLHMRNSTTVKSGQDITRGTVLGYEGSSGGNYDVHLHMDYGVPKERLRSAWITANNPGKVLSPRQVYSNVSIKGLYNTDPTPYMPRDQLYNSTKVKTRAAYEKYYGNSWRTQFNTLYGANLPLGAGAKKPTAELPKTYLNQLKTQYENGDGLTPEELAAARRSLAEGAMVADSAGYNVGGQWLSQRTLASFMLVDDGKDFADMPSLMEMGDITVKSPKELVIELGTRRYGNAQWERDLMKLNTKGLETEKMMIVAQRNFVREQTSQVRTRIEGLLATLTMATLEENKKKIEAMQIAAQAGAVPRMIDLKLEASGDEWIGGYGGGAQCVPTAGSGETVSSDGAVYIGDSIAVGYGGAIDPKGRHNAGKQYGSYAYGGQSGEWILDTAIKSAAPHLKGKTVVLSTGLTNSLANYRLEANNAVVPFETTKYRNKSIKLVRDQLQALKNAGVANVVVLGIVDDFNVKRLAGSRAIPEAQARAQAKAVNDELRKLAAEFGFSYQPIGASNGDTAHPKYGAGLKSLPAPGSTSAVHCEPGMGAYNGPLPTDLEGVKQALLQTIFLAESANNAGGWNASNNGTIGKKIVCSRPSGGVWNLTNMTLGEMKRVYRGSGQSRPRSVNDCSRLFAAGRYQFIKDTFEHTQKLTGLPDSAKFTPEVQNKFAEALMMYKIGDFMYNKGMSARQAKVQLARTWASLGVPGQEHSCKKDSDKMRGYYGGANAAKCGVTLKVWALIDQADKIHKGQK